MIRPYISHRPLQVPWLSKLHPFFKACSNPTSSRKSALTALPRKGVSSSELCLPFKYLFF